ncbi:hypothetical protein K505DRAFT_192414, partial [Melanomma pulvis-pyrius CBS 109.77]
MPRPKVADGARQRVANACQPCKTNKQKCDGKTPCFLCTRRGRATRCIYSSRDISSPLRRNAPPLRSDVDVKALPGTDGDTGRPRSLSTTAEQPTSGERMPCFLLDIDGEDKVYIGDAAALSFLQTIRHFVQRQMGPNVFSSDPRRHSMLEQGVPAQTVRMEARDFPELTYAKEAAEAYFASVSRLRTFGLIDILDVPQFYEDLARWIHGYFPTSEPTSAIFFLVLAIGAQSRSADALDERRAQVYFNHGRQLACLNLLDDPSIATTQAYILIAFHMLAACRRNGAYMNLGIAARSAHAMGLHRRAANAALDDSDAMSRSRIWKTLRLLDLIVSSTLGRPSATSAQETDFTHERCIRAPTHAAPRRDIPALALSEAVRVFLIVETIVADVYSKKTISIAEAETISAQLRRWSAQLPKELRETESSDALGGMEGRAVVLAKANVAFCYYYAMMLLMRPFLIFHLKRHADAVACEGTGPERSAPEDVDSEKVANACIDSAVYMLDLMWSLMQNRMLFKNMTFIIAWVFGAGLVAGLAFFGSLGSPVETSRALTQALAVCTFFAATSPQAQRYHAILTSLLTACRQYHTQLSAMRPASRRRIVAKIFEL